MKRMWLDLTLVAVIAACTTMPVFGAHYMTLTWTAPTDQPSGSYINVYRGTAAGGESTTAIAKLGAPSRPMRLETPRSRTR